MTSCAGRGAEADFLPRHWGGALCEQLLLQRLVQRLLQLLLQPL